MVVRPVGRPPPLISSSPFIPVGDFSKATKGESDFALFVRRLTRFVGDTTITPLRPSNRDFRFGTLAGSSYLSLSRPRYNELYQSRPPDRRPCYSGSFRRPLPGCGKLILFVISRSAVGPGKALSPNQWHRLYSLRKNGRRLVGRGFSRDLKPAFPSGVSTPEGILKSFSAACLVCAVLVFGHSGRCTD